MKLFSMAIVAAFLSFGSYAYSCDCGKDKAAACSCSEKDGSCKGHKDKDGKTCAAHADTKDKKTETK